MKTMESRRLSGGFSVKEWSDKVGLSYITYRRARSRPFATLDKFYHRCLEFLGWTNGPKLIKRCRQRVERKCAVENLCTQYSRARAVSMKQTLPSIMGMGQLLFAHFAGCGLFPVLILQDPRVTHVPLKIIFDWRALSGRRLELHLVTLRERVSLTLKEIDLVTQYEVDSLVDGDFTPVQISAIVRDIKKQSDALRVTRKEANLDQTLNPNHTHTDGNSECRS